MTRIDLSMTFAIALGAALPVGAQNTIGEPQPFELLMNNISELAAPTLDLITAHEKFYSDAGINHLKEEFSDQIEMNWPKRYDRLNNYDHLKSVRRINPFLGDFRGQQARTKAPSERTLTTLKFLGIGTDLLDLADARRLDRELARNGRYNPAASHVIDKSARIAIKLLEFMPLKGDDYIGKLPRRFLKFHFPKMDWDPFLRRHNLKPRKPFLGALDRLGAFADLAEGGGRIAGGDYSKSSFDAVFDGGWDLFVLSQVRNGKLTARHAFFDPAFKIVTTGFKHWNGKHSRLDLIEDFATSSLDLLVTGVGARYCQGNFTCTAAVQSLGRATAGTVKSGSTVAGRFAMPRLFGQHKTVLKQYDDHLAFARASGTKAKTVTQMMGADSLRNLGVSPFTIRRLNKETDSHNRSIALNSTMAPIAVKHSTSFSYNPVRLQQITPLRPIMVTPVNPTTSTRGGIKLTHQSGTAVQADLSAVTDAILGR